MEVEIGGFDGVDIVDSGTNNVELREIGVQFSREEVDDPVEVLDFEQEVFEAVLRRAGELPLIGELAFELFDRTVGTDMLAVGLDRRLVGDRRVATVGGAVATGPHDQRLQLVAREHLAEFVAPRV